MPIQSSRVPVGSRAPALILPAGGGDWISLEDYTGRRSVVLVFLRGFG